MAPIAKHMSSDSLYLHMHRVIWTFKTISSNKSLSKHNMFGMAFPGVQWKREQNMQLYRKYYVNGNILKRLYKEVWTKAT